MDFGIIKACSCFVLLIFLEVCAEATDAENARTKRTITDAFCVSRTDGKIYPDPEDCRSYVYCSGGYAYKSTCSPGLYYEAKIQACEFDNGQCVGSFGVQKSPVPHPNEVEEKPPPTKEYTVTKIQRDFDEGTFCRNRVDGTYEHPTHCNGYIFCANGISFPGSCPRGLIFNERLNGCDFDLEGVCDMREFQKFTTNPVDVKDGESYSHYLTTLHTHLPKLPTLSAARSEQLAQSMPDAIERALDALTLELKREAEMSKRLSGVKRPFKLVQQFLKTAPLAKQLSMSAFILNNASRAILDNLDLSQEEGLAFLQSMSSPLPASSYRINSDDTFPNPDPGSCPWPSYNCRLEKYRSYDGSCNNLHKPLWGRSFIPLKRFLPPDYGDGLQTLRRARDGSKLPSARLVSFTISEDRNLPHHINSQVLMQWGQFLDHDMSLTALSQMATEPTGSGSTTDIECGHDGCRRTHEACWPIPVPTNDPRFYGKKCLEFVRSQFVPSLNCTMGPRQQLNQISSYLDASNVYGSTKRDADKLREVSNNRGRLKVTTHPRNRYLKPLLPESHDDEECNESNEGELCFKAGDSRVNEQVGLTVMHTVLMREHNQIERVLHEINPQWSGETLYQETRRIVGAMTQHVTFNEFLPLVLGPGEVKKHGVDLRQSGYYSGYDSGIDATIANSFTTAAFRFGHTLLQSSLHRMGTDYKSGHFSPLSLNQLFFRPYNLLNPDEGGIDAYLRGMLATKIQKHDRFVTDQVTVHLFADHPPNGLGADLVSLNIQRGRDHGIPGYNEWREWCGLKRAVNFDDLQDITSYTVRNKFKAMYRNVNDIDLFPAGISEKSVDGGLLGPTFACIIGRQFQDLRRGDRFWYENNGAFRFTEAQLKELRKASLAKMICDNADSIHIIQPSAMQLPFRSAYPNMMEDDEEAEKHGLNLDWFSRLWDSNFNQRVNCSCLPSMDFSKWRAY